MTMVELVPGVHRIEAEVGGRPLYLFAFLGERRLLLDAGCASTVDEFIAPSLGEVGLGLLDLDVLVVTHSDLDHQGGAHLLKRANPSLWVTCGLLDIPQVSSPDALVAERYQAYAALHGITPDADAIAWMRRESGGPVRVDVGWSGGELLELAPDWSVQILHVPGHSVGHIAVYDERSDALFSGDCLQGSVYLGLDGTPKLCPTYTHVDDYLETASLVDHVELALKGTIPQNEIASVVDNVGLPVSSINLTYGNSGVTGTADAASSVRIVAPARDALVVSPTLSVRINADPGVTGGACDSCNTCGLCTTCEGGRRGIGGWLDRMGLGSCCPAVAVCSSWSARRCSPTRPSSR